MGLPISRGVYPEVPETTTVGATAETTGRGVRAIGRAEREPDRRGAHDDRSGAHDDRDPAEICGVAGGRIRKGEERDSFGASTVGRDEAVIRDYIRRQEQEDQRLDQLKLEY
jgi:hypothetical protein